VSNKRKGKKMRYQPDRNGVLQFFKKNKSDLISAKNVVRVMGRNAGDIIKELVGEGRLIKVGKRYMLPERAGVVKGKFDGKVEGYGFIIPEDGSQDIFIPPGSTFVALNGDIVLAVKTKKRRGKWEGKIIRVIKRAKKRFAGKIINEDGILYLKPVDKHIPYFFFIVNDKKRKERPGDFVVAEMFEWKNPNVSPSCKVIKKVGKKEVETMLIEEEFGLKEGFSNSIKNEVLNIQILLDKERKDFVKQYAVTIDPEDAKDFDDAVAIEKKNGFFYLYVHIADVSAYVRKNSLTDREAEKRGCSVYLPHRTYFMLPQELTKNISLTEGNKKPVYSVIAKINSEGEVVDYIIQRGLIVNKKRLSYKSAEEILESGNGKDLSTSLRTMKELADILTAKKAHLGRIDFKVPEVEVKVEDDKVLSISPTIRLPTHRIIEEFMILANELVAENIYNSKRSGIYRVHEEPDDVKLMEFKKFAYSLGYKLKGLSRKDIQRFLLDVEGEPFERILNYELLRCMKRARYVAIPEPHFGLASKLYTHFTSPIRRYPDLVVHRILSGENYSIDELRKIADHSTEMEWKSDEAERKAIEMFTLKFLQDHKEEEFIGLIRDVAASGLFVELEDFLISGFLPVSLLPDEDYMFRGKELLGQRHRFFAGERIAVSVQDIEPLTGNLTLRYIGKVVRK